MRIDVWSDVVCPWCWIGKRRFERALELLGDEAAGIEVHWHAFELDPDAGEAPVPLREALAEKFGGAARCEQMLAQTQATARAEGLPMDFDRGQVRVSTRKAHRLAWLAAREGHGDAVREALFHAHFAEGRNLADPAVLADVARAGGLEAARVHAWLAGDEGLAAVEDDLARARALGIGSVPTFVVDGRWAVQGAQPPDAFVQALRQVAAATPASAAAGDDGACDDGSCRV